MTANTPQVKSQRCVWIECAGCGTDCYDEGTPHYSSEAEARAQLISEDGWGWTERNNGELLCRACGTGADCAEHGHEMSPWFTYPADPEIEWRHCAHCGAAIEDRLVALGGDR